MVGTDGVDLGSVGGVNAGLAGSVLAVAGAAVDADAGAAFCWVAACCCSFGRVKTKNTRALIASAAMMMSAGEALLP